MLALGPSFKNRSLIYIRSHASSSPLAHRAVNLRMDHPFELAFSWTPMVQTIPSAALLSCIIDFADAAFSSVLRSASTSFRHASLDPLSGTTAHSALGAQWDGDWIQNNPKRGFSPLGYATLRRDWLRSLSGGTEGLQQIICICILAEGPNSIKIFGRTLPSGANKISAAFFEVGVGLSSKVVRDIVSASFYEILCPGSPLLRGQIVLRGTGLRTYLAFEDTYHGYVGYLRVYDEFQSDRLAVNAPVATSRQMSGQQTRFTPFTLI
ncbi:hypothetical protein B0H13DRAFT_1921453 [Mycena leptocephala]|nr:hypothetical protein B0H13DRAFT_1921453 [Mycena leptocephala]